MAELHQFCQDNWAMLSGLAMIVFLAIVIILERRVKNAIKPVLEGFVSRDVCETSHTGIEKNLREFTQMVSSSLSRGDARFISIEKAIRLQGADTSMRLDTQMSQISGRLDVFETVSTQRYDHIKKGLDDTLGKFDTSMRELEKKLETHLIENGVKK